MSRITHHRRAVLPLAMACIAAAWWGCSSQVTTTATATTSGNPGGSAEVTVGSGGASSGGAGGAGGMNINVDAGDDGAVPIDDAGVCSSTSAAAPQTPLDVILLIDRSGSMASGKWTGLSQGLTTFFSDANSTGIGVGLVYFPNDKPDDCVSGDYATLDVPIGALPGNAPALSSSLSSTSPAGGDTPMYGALQGALFAATGYQDMNMTHKVILVMATDGDPTGCVQTGIPAIAGLAKSALNYNGVQTYVIGVQGATLQNLDAIASAGGTGNAVDITLDVTQLAAKMAEIQMKAVACQFLIPKPPNNQPLDPDKVNLEYTPKGMGKPKILPRADNLADCSGMAGWYYDNNMTPTSILLCPASCATVQADVKAKIDVLFGCKSQLN